MTVFSFWQNVADLPRFDCFKGSGFHEWVAFCFVVGLKVMG